MKILKAEVQKLLASSYTRAIGLTAFGVGVVLSVFDGINMLAQPERALDPELVANFYTDTVFLAWLFPAILGILLMTSEFRWGTAIHTFLQTPKRGMVVLWKMLAAVLGGALIALASLAGAFITATVILTIVGDYALPEPGRLIGGTVAMVIIGMIGAPLGVAVGALIRAQLAALAVFLGWMLLVEQAAAVALGPAGIYLPGAMIPRALSLEWTATGLSGIFTEPITPISAMIFLAIEAVLLGVIASYTTLRKDIE